MEQQQKRQNNEAQMIIDDLHHKLEAMTVSSWFWVIFRFVNLSHDIFQHEIKSLEKALVELTRNNDTGFSDFLGAIDSKDIEAQQKVRDNLHSLRKSF